MQLDRSNAALLLIDIQEKLYPVMDRGAEVVDSILLLIKGCQILNIPIFISEQYPKGLGETILPIRTLLGAAYQPHIKTTFSCFEDEAFGSFAKTLPQTQWILAGLETHICLLQTAKGLLRLGNEVVAVNDATTSRSIFDFSTAIAELRDEGARISSVETILFELLGHSKAKEFAEISQLVRSRSSCCSCHS